MRKLAVAVVALALAGCGGQDKPSDSEQVRDTLVSFGRATSAHDYKKMCSLLAPVLVDKLRQVGLGCEQALEQGLGKVRSPKLTVGRITVNGPNATAEVRSSADGEAPSDDTVELRRVKDDWRIASLATASGPGPGP